MRHLFIGFLAAGLAACGGNGESHEDSDSDHTSGDESAYEGPIGSADTAAGQGHFENLCAGCHPGGGEGVGPAVANIAWTPARVRMQIREGEGRMPAFDESRLSAAQLEELLAYLTTTGSVTGELPAGGGAEPLDDGGDVAPDDTTTDDTM